MKKSGDVFGKWTLIEKDENRKRYWVCRCSCGTIKSVQNSVLSRKGSYGCSRCCNKKPAEDLTGQKFGKWVVIERMHSEGMKPIWLCECECGVKKTVSGAVLKRGTSKSCGCSSYKGRGFKGNQAAISLVFCSRKGEAKRRGITFELSPSFTEELIQQPCYYCGAPPSNICTTNIGRQVIYSGIDRIDNSKGYEESNVVPCCKRCNQAKNNMTLGEFSEWLNRIYNNFIKRV